MRFKTLRLLLKRISRDSLEKIRGLRNRLVHDLANIDFDVISKTIFEDIPELISTHKCA